MKRPLHLRLKATMIALVAAISLGPTTIPRSHGSSAWPHEPAGH